MPKCPVCKSDCQFHDLKCSLCGFPDPCIEFVSHADAEEWRIKTLEPSRAVWRKAHEDHASARAAALRIIYSAAKAGHFKTAISTNDTFQYITDGYRSVRYPLGFEVVSPITNHPDSLRIRKQTDDIINDTQRNGVELPLPPIQHLKRMQQAGEKVFDFGHEKPLVNVAFLIDMIEALPEPTAMCLPGNALSAICFYSKHGAGMLLPIKKLK